jgi:hypothetical protein
MKKLSFPSVLVGFITITCTTPHQNKIHIDDIVKFVYKGYKREHEPLVTSYALFINGKNETAL